VDIVRLAVDGVWSRLYHVGMAENPQSDVARNATLLAQRIDGTFDSFESARTIAGREYHQLLEAVKSTHQRFAFDRDGRPAAIAAVREALPQMERELFEAVLEDQACELAATEEALFQLVQTLIRART
jgi:hypothetical protein